MFAVYYVCVLCLVYYFSSANEIRLKAKEYSGYQGKVEIVGVISITTASSLIRCIHHCAINDKCLTLFFNKNIKQCIMHSKHFFYQEPSTIQTGWNYYIMKDVTGRCRPEYPYYRNLDFCYFFDQISRIDNSQIKAKCSQNSAQLAAITSQVKYDYFQHIFANRSNSRGFIQGTRINGQWTLDNGTSQTYFNWALNEPDNKGDCLLLKAEDNDRINDCPCNFPSETPAVFICER